MVKAYLHKFQEDSVQELLKKGTYQIMGNRTVKDTMENPIIFSSPTGSGKTIMSISFIQRLRNHLIENKDTAISSMNNFGKTTEQLNSNILNGEVSPLFIYFVPSSGGLGDQILKEVSFHSKWTVSDGEEELNIIDSESILNGTSEVKENSVLVITWDKYIKKNNIVNQITENNTTSTHLDLLTTTLTKNRPVIALIDEAHSHFNDKAKSVVSRFKPDLLVKISATPKEAYKDTESISMDVLSRTVLVPIEEVRKSGLIKDKIEIISSLQGKPLSLSSCLEKSVLLQKELTEILHDEVLYGNGQASRGKKMTINTIENPLILIQIDNDSEFKSSKLLEVVANLKALDLQDSEIVTWFSNKKPTDEQLAKAKVLIFKTAIALGWDYPRSHILVKLRETKSKSFDIQTIGRLTRLSNGRNNLDFRYEDERLRTAYVFVENGVTATDFDDTVSSLLGKFIYINENNYMVKELKRDSLAKFNQIGLKNGDVSKLKIDDSDVIFDNVKQILNSAINQELTNQQHTQFIVEKTFSDSIKENYTGEVEEVFKGQYNEQGSESFVIDDITMLLEMLKTLILKTLRNSKLKRYALESSNSVVVTRNRRDESLLSVFKTNRKLKEILADNSFPSDSKLEKDTSLFIFLLNNQGLVVDILNKFEDEFLNNHSKEGIVEGSVFEIKETIYIENQNFIESKEQDSWLYPVFPSEISKTSTEENEFLDFLIRNENIEFVYKNGVGGDAFSISYQEKLTHKNKNYYPDFIVVTKEGKVVILDYKQEAVDSNIFEKFIAGKNFEARNKRLVLDNQYSDLTVTMVVNVAKQGNPPIYKYLDNASYISVKDTNYTRYWLDIDLLLK